MFRRTHKDRRAGIHPKHTTPLPPQRKRRLMRHIWPDYLKPGLASIPNILAWPFQKFTIIAALSQNHKLKSETPKVIMERSRWKTADNCVIHLLPLAVVIALLALNFSQVYAGDVGASNPSAKLNALQFAAKLHEVLMAASLSSIVLHCVQYELLHGEGVPLGGLLAGFQVTDLDSLWSPGLWAIIFVEGEKFRRVLLAMLVATLVILVAIVGPSSAILMLPSLDWWEYQHTAAEVYPYYTNNEVRFFIGANESTLWPRHITLENFHPLECNSTNDTVPFYCPLGAFSTLLDLASPDLVISSIWSDHPNYWNITLPFDIDTWSFSQYVEGAYGKQWLEVNPLALALTQTTPLAADILLAHVQNEFWGGGLRAWSESIIFKISLKNNSLIPAPSTYATCSDDWYKWENGTLVNENSGPLELVFPLNNGITRWSAPSPQLFDVWNNSTEYAAAWVEAPDIGADSPSIGAVFAAFGNFSNGNNYTDTSRYDARLSCCSVVSSWEPVQIYTNPKTDTYFHSPTVDNAPNTAFDSAYLAGFKAIKFDLDWAESAIPANETLVPLNLKLTGQENLGSWTTNFPMAVSILVTTVLSRIGANISDIITGNFIQPGLIPGNLIQPGWIPGSLIMNRSDDGNAGDWTEFKVAVLRYGYGYSMRGLTRRLATGILLTYLLIVVVYLVIILWSG